MKEELVHSLGCHNCPMLVVLHSSICEKNRVLSESLRLVIPITPRPLDLSGELAVHLEVQSGDFVIRRVENLLPKVEVATIWGKGDVGDAVNLKTNIRRGYRLNRYYERAVCFVRYSHMIFLGTAILELRRGRQFTCRD